MKEEHELEVQSEESYDGSVFGEESEDLESEEGEEVIWIYKFSL